MNLTVSTAVFAVAASILAVSLNLIKPTHTRSQTTIITKQNKLPIKTQEPPPPEEPINQLPTEGPGELEDKPAWEPTITDNEKHIVPPETTTQLHVDVCARFGGHKVITHHGVYWHCVYPRR